MYRWIKELIKNLPGIRRIVEERDCYIQLYAEQELLNRQLQIELDVRTTHCQQLDAVLCDKEKVCSEFRETNRAQSHRIEDLRSKVSELDQEYINLTFQNQIYMNKISVLEAEKTH